MGQKWVDFGSFFSVFFGFFPFFAPRARARGKFFAFFPRARARAGNFLRRGFRGEDVFGQETEKLYARCAGEKNILTQDLDSWFAISRCFSRFWRIGEKCSKSYLGCRSVGMNHSLTVPGHNCRRATKRISWPQLWRRGPLQILDEFRTPPNALETVSRSIWSSTPILSRDSPQAGPAAPMFR